MGGYLTILFFTSLLLLIHLLDTYVRVPEESHNAVLAIQSRPRMRYLEYPVFRLEVEDNRSRELHHFNCFWVCRVVEVVAGNAPDLISPVFILGDSFRIESLCPKYHCFQHVFWRFHFAFF